MSFITIDKQIPDKMVSEIIDQKIGVSCDIKDSEVNKTVKTMKNDSILFLVKLLIF